jgi:hypothetical protein
MYDTYTTYTMKRETLEQFINDGKSINDISLYVGKSATSIRYWLSKYGLKTQWNGFLQQQYSDEELLKVANSSLSFSECLDKLCDNHSGGAFYHYKERLEKIGFDFSRFTNSNGGKVTAVKRNRETINRPTTRRLKRGVLNTFLHYNNIPYECSDCHMNEWRGKKLILHIHHRDENPRNNTLENICYLCPNCHNITHYSN